MILYLVNGMVVEVDEGVKEVMFGKNDPDIPCHTIETHPEDRKSLMVMAGKVVAYRD